MRGCSQHHNIFIGLMILSHMVIKYNMDFVCGKFLPIFDLKIKDDMNG